MLPTEEDAMKAPNTLRRLRAHRWAWIAGAVLAGCGGGGDAGSPANGSASREQAATYAPALLPPLVTSGPKYYFSDCQAGALPGCVPGDNANAGTSPSAPKRTPDGINLNLYPAGTQLLFASGGAWNDIFMLITNPNATVEQPIVFDTYVTPWGGSRFPHLKARGDTVLRFDAYNDTVNDGGYHVRNLKLDGNGTAQYGIYLSNDVHHVTIDNVEITGAELGMYSASGNQPGRPGVAFLTVRRSYIHHNSQMGILGDAKDLLIESNNISENNFSGSELNHGIYLGGFGERGIVRYNTLQRNSVVDGVCQGGNFTVHGQWDGLLVEGNQILQSASGPKCQGISINPGYSGARLEWFLNVVLRGNAVVNMGGIGIGLTSAPGAIVENNLVVNTQPAHQLGIAIPDRSPTAPEERIDSGALVRNNTVYFAQPGGESKGIALKNVWDRTTAVPTWRYGPGTGLTVVSNLVYMGAGPGQGDCFDHVAPADFMLFDNNLCYGLASTNRWSAEHANLAAAQAAGFDPNGLNVDPLFIALPTATTYWTDALHTTSPAVNAGHPTMSSPRERGGFARVVPDIGARE
jgi:hypothetical protein